MLSKYFIFTFLFSGITLLFVSCLENATEKEYKHFYTISPTDSSNFTISLDGIETIKTPNFNLDGKWRLIENTGQKTKSLYLTFEGRKIYSTLNLNYSNQQKNTNTQKNNSKDKYTVFAIYDKCPDENGTYDKKGTFLVIGSGDEKITCYKVTSYEATRLTLYDVAKGGELEFEKVD
ncbi:hypothetical protein ACE193_00150 [Bernardetia sp. OM2101]|uniref:hypothetical protein n=1 Tax=Bernardetia sp. OM2101 TaxID=3344876 RepID=UPI0035CEDD57